MSSNQFEIVDSPTDAISSACFARGSPTRLIVSSWDRHVYLYDIQEPGGRLVRKIEHAAPVLDVCFGKDDNEAFSAGLDCEVRRLDLESDSQTSISSHEAGVKCIEYCPSTSTLVSAAWDCTLQIHFPSNPTHVSNTIRLPSKPFAMSMSESKLVVAMASRILHIYDLKGLSLLASQSSQPAPNELEIEPWQKRESSLKFMTRAVACMPHDAGYASSSIEGRVAVEWFDSSAESQARKYAFKCHRMQSGGTGAGAGAGTGPGQDTVDEGPVDIVYPVNALAFHPIHGTFASGGGDGIVALWDVIAKRRIRQYQRYPSSVATMDFSHNGKYLAVGISPGFEDGQEDMAQGAVKLYIRELGESEAKSKGAK